MTIKYNNNIVSLPFHSTNLDASPQGLNDSGLATSLHRESPEGMEAEEDTQGGEGKTGRREGMSEEEIVSSVLKCYENIRNTIYLLC